MLIDNTYKNLGIRAEEAKAGVASLVLFKTAHDAEVAASWLDVGESIFEAVDGFLLKINGYFLTTDWGLFREMVRRVTINYRLI